MSSRFGLTGDCGLSSCFAGFCLGTHGLQFARKRTENIVEPSWGRPHKTALLRGCRHRILLIGVYNYKRKKVKKYKLLHGRDKKILFVVRCGRSLERVNGRQWRFNYSQTSPYGHLHNTDTSLLWTLVLSQRNWQALAFIRSRISDTSIIWRPLDIFRTVYFVLQRNQNQ